MGDSFEIEDRFESYAWTLQKYGNAGNAAFMRYSRKHLLDPERPGIMLCGRAPGSLHYGHSDSGRCLTCYRRATSLLAHPISNDLRG